MEQEPNLPVSYPIKTLKDLEEGNYYRSYHYMFNRSSVPLKSPTSKANRPRLLACHDYKGGYVDDQWIQGSQNGSAYTLTNWHSLDIFIYFSHNLVTLPPPGWINAAHRHGVQVLGTFITEWDEGYKVCQELCATEESAKMYASLLAELAQALGFDGWLVNIENKVPDLVPNLLLFVSHLTDAMHDWVPGSTVIWYDSVTIDGELRWQNRLNERNKPFFDISDSFFTNYQWTERWAKESGDLGEERRFDVYMGIDVFGRGTYGGGGYHCDVALKAAQEAQVSAALFAPGWTYENNEDDNRWWRSVYNCWPDARVDPVQLPFFTNFDVGHGQATFIQGRQVSDLPWSNLSCQSLQPRLRVETLSSERLRVSLRQDSPIYSGGSSIDMVGDIASDDACIFQLYNTAVHVDEARDETCLNVSYSVLAQSSSNFCLALRTEELLGGCSVHFLLEVEEEAIDTFIGTYEIGHTSVIFDYFVRKGDSKFSGDNKVGSKRMESSSVELWSRREFTLPQDKYIITGVFGVCSAAEDLRPLLIKLVHDNEGVFEPKNFQIPEDERAKADSERKESKDTYHAVLGHLSLTKSSHNCHFPYPEQRFIGNSITWTEGIAGEKFMSAKLVWRGHPDKSTWERFHLHAKVSHLDDGNVLSLQYLGMAVVEAFYVFELQVPKQSTAIEFYLQPQCACGNVQCLTKCSTYKRTVPLPSSNLWMKPHPSLKDWLFIQER